MGRSTKFSDEMVEKAKYLARDGLTDEEMSKELGIGVRTFYQWQKKYPHFKQALKENKGIVDHKVEDALLKRALGYEYEETEITASKDGKTSRVKKIKKVIPPDTVAIIFWLKNRQPEKWRDKLNHHITTEETEAEIEVNIVDNDNE